ncbi:MAG TPA: hypothetical protein VKW78_08105 [Terriglobales bacterium]|nr:hypothetical protein [Terriglobales bacterium]
MQRTHRNNSEYMQVVMEVVCCLVNQLHHPKLSSPRAEEITAWFHQVQLEEVVLAMTTLETRKRIPPQSKRPAEAD